MVRPPYLPQPDGTLAEVDWKELSPPLSSPPLSSPPPVSTEDLPEEQSSSDGQSSFSSRPHSLVALNKRKGHEAQEEEGKEGEGTPERAIERPRLDSNSFWLPDHFFHLQKYGSKWSFASDEGDPSSRLSSHPFVDAPLKNETPKQGKEEKEEEKDEEEDVEEEEKHEEEDEEEEGGEGEEFYEEGATPFMMEEEMAKEMEKMMQLADRKLLEQKHFNQ